MGYPPHWEADVVAADGGVLQLRPIRPEDAERLVTFHAGLSSRTRYLRYFSAYPTIPARDLKRFVEVDHHDRVALVAWQGDTIVAVGRYERDPGTTAAEVAFVVADSHQGRGIGSILLEHLAAAGRECGLTRFTALVLAENRAMLRVFTDAGYRPDHHYDGSEVELSFEITETESTESVARDRERRSEAASIRRLLRPSSVAVVGASSDPDKIGGALFRNLLRSGFDGPLYPVHPTRRHIGGVPAHPSVTDIPDPVDLAVIAVPSATVIDVVEQCAERGVRGLIVISGGFGERGDESGLAAQRELVRRSRSRGMRVVGPNCLGVINTESDVSLNASLAPLPPRAGRAGFFCQSGALGVAVLGEAARRGLGISTFVSAGNRVDVSGNDLLQYWQDDPATDLAMMYLESFGNPRKFARLARRFGRSKPIIAVKSGRHGMVAGLQHTSVEVPETSVQALFEASGVIRVDNTSDMFDVALLLLTQPLPTGGRVSVVGNSTALAMLVADALDVAGLQLARVVDIGTEADPQQFRAGLDEGVSDGDVDAVIAVFVPPLARTSGEQYAIELREAVAELDKPVLSTFLGFEGVPASLAQPGALSPTFGSVPSYPSPERAVAALARAVRYATWRSRPAGVVPELTGVQAGPARRLIDELLRETPSGRWLSHHEASQLCQFAGIAVVTCRDVTDLAEAVAAAEKLGWPVALRRRDAAEFAVRLHLADPDAVAEAWQSLQLPESCASASVQPMVPRGVDTVFGLADDRSFGALVSFGVGGVATDLLGDRAFAVVPLTGQDAATLITSPKAVPLLTGYRAAPPADLRALADIASRLSWLADQLPEVVTVELAPVVATPQGAHVLAVSARVAPPVSRGDTGPRRLRGL